MNVSISIIPVEHFIKTKSGMSSKPDDVLLFMPSIISLTSNIERGLKTY
jgi:hypothetical protein